MMIFDIFSKRKQKERGEQSDVYIYDKLPDKLKVQIIHIITEVFGVKIYGSEGESLLHQVKEILYKEYGVFYLVDKYENNDENIKTLANFLLKTDDIEKCLDVIELCFKAIEFEIAKNSYKYNTNIDPKKALEELNIRFQENSVGYAYEHGEIIRIDSGYIHKETVIPTLILLADKSYKGANEEFLKAHEHYRHKRYKECLTECLKAFESTLKIICDKQGWTYNKTDTAKPLITIVVQNNLLPTFLQTQMNTMKALMESGIPTIRNKLSGHGQGGQITDVPPYIVSYMLHLTATTIHMLVEAEKELK